MYRKFTDEQAKFILENFATKLVGQPFDDELKITHVWVIPSDQDSEKIIQMYHRGQTTCEEIVERFGNGRNLYVLAYSFDIIRLRILPHQDVSEYLSKAEIESVLALDPSEEEE